MLCGLWVGPSKPPMDKLLEPIMENLKQLSTEGLIVRHPNGMSHIKGKLVLSVFDLPAKASILAMKQFNGAYGCSVCLHPGKHLPNNSRVYLPEVHVENTHDSIVQSGKQVLRDGIAVDGVLGVSPLADILDLVACIPIDYMHCCLEGIVKMLLHFLTDSSNYSQPYYELHTQHASSDPFM